MRSVFAARAIETRQRHAPLAAPVHNHRETHESGARAGSPLFLQRAAVSRAADATHRPANLAERIANTSGGGQLDPATHARLEEHLGADLPAMRIHHDSESDLLAHSVQAKAFTSGHHVFFSSGTLDPNSSQGFQTLAHEATHVLQQAAGPVAGVPMGPGLSVSHPSDRFEQEADRVARQTSPNSGRQLGGIASGGHVGRNAPPTAKPQPGPGISVQRQDQPQALPQVPTPTGSPSQQLSGPEAASFIVLNPHLETDPGLHDALVLLRRYAPTVDVGKVEFRVMDEASRASYLGSSLSEDGRSYWEGNVPVVELPASAFELLSQHSVGSAPVNALHKVLRTIGHELYHLTRTKTGNKSDPIQPVYEAEAIRRMEAIHQNWVRFLHDPGGRKTLNLPANLQINKWEDIPQAQRKDIEKGASQTSEIQGFYEQSAYLVEEIYVRIEELSFLRVQQRNEQGADSPSAGEIRKIASLIYFFNNLLTSASQSGSGVVTPQLLQQAHAAMLTYLRARYPHRGNSTADSYEVIFYLTAINAGLPPIYGSDGHLISLAPPGARVP